VEIPFTFDELSALSRTQFDSFNDMIRIGVIEKDSHPAGIQVFLYYWVKLFGERESAVKLPFIVAGVFSIYLVYRIGKLWFGETAGVLTAVFMSSLQFFVMYSQIARPYISGLFFTLAATFYWSKYFYTSPKSKYLVGFVIFSTLSAYNHYFSLLYVAVLGISGLFMIKRKNLLAYVIGGIAILMLYSPHLPIVLAQAEKGTIGGWLGVPGPYFMLEFICWLFHHSYLLLLITSSILLLGLFVFKNNKNNKVKYRKKRWLLFFWLLPAPLFGYIYSYVQEPILQYSLLIFTTPYFFLLLFSFVGEWKKFYLGLAVLLILTVNIFTLTFNQDYYNHFYRQPFEQLVKNALEIESQNKDEIFILNNYIPYYSEYYFRKYKKELSYYSTRNKDLSISDFKKVLSEIKNNIVITSGLDDQYFQLIKEQFPYWVNTEKGFTYEQYIFSKDSIKGSKILERQLLTEVTFDTNKNTTWVYNKENVLFDSLSESFQYLMKPDELYGQKIELPLSSISSSIYFIVDAEVEVVAKSSDLQAVLVGEIKNNNDLIHWLGADFSEFMSVPDQSQKIFLTIDIQKALSDKNRLNNKVLRFYIWNRNREQFAIEKIKIYVRSGNPDRYRL
jgi:hypothetical protein